MPACFTTETSALLLCGIVHSAWTETRAKAQAGLRVLVVEDDKAALLATGLHLFSKGHEVTTAVSGAMARSAAGPFDVAVLELRIDDELGAELAAWLLVAKRVDGVVFYTAEPHSSDAEWAQLIGPVVSKQDGLDVLERAVRGIAGKVVQKRGQKQTEPVK